MGFPSVCCTVLLPSPLAFVVHLLDSLKLALFYLGLSSSSSYDDDDGDYFFVYTLHSLPVLPASSSSSSASAAIKTRLPIVEFSALQAGALADCAVCLGALEATHEVRALGNCSHAFHKGCIDKWVDIGQLTCPLCRAPLLPMEKEREEEQQQQEDSAVGLA